MNEPLSSIDLADSDGALDRMSGDGHPVAASSGWNILLIEDDPVVARTTNILFRLAGHRVELAGHPDTAFSLLARRRYDAILLDLNFTMGRSDGAEGLACLRRIMAGDPSACVVVITAHSGIRIAIEAMQAGARDFVMKPWRREVLLDKVAGAVGRSVRPAAGRPTGNQGSSGPVLLGTSVQMAAIRDLVRRVGPTIASVCISGRSGTGRSLVAAAVHAASGDADRVPLRLDLRSAEDWALLDGASGTALLRHVDRLDAVGQGRLFDRLPPGLRGITIVDDAARLLPALRRRLCTVEIAVPRLIDRRGDAVLLARHFAAVAGESYRRPAPALTPAAEAMIAATDWPDEVRGLAMAIERAVLLADDGVIDAAAIRPADGDAPPPVPGTPFGLGDAERLLIAAALKDHRHNVSRAATALGISRGTLYRRMAQYGL
jgi:DNA-binding NtrC family response regulator